jgi:hypothetical protein
VRGGIGKGDVIGGERVLELLRPPIFFVFPVEIMGRMPHDLHHNALEGKPQFLSDS